MRRIKWFFVLLLFPLAIFGLFYHLNKHGLFDIDRIEIILTDTHGQEIYLKPKVEKVDRFLETFRGRSTWSVDMGEIATSLREEEWIEEFEISRQWPATLALRIRPYRVKALLMERRDRLRPVIADGRVLSSVDASLAPDVVILEGKSFAEKEELRQKALRILADVPDDGSFSKGSISEMRWSQKEGFYARVIKSGVQVKLGEDRIALKSARVSQVLDYLSNRGISVESIDANLSKKVLVRVHESSRGIKIE